MSFLIPPEITTITQSYECGVQAANILIQRIKNSRKSEPQYIELPTKLVIRGSTNPKIKK